MSEKATAGAFRHGDDCSRNYLEVQHLRRRLTAATNEAGRLRAALERMDRGVYKAGALEKCNECGWYAPSKNPECRSCITRAALSGNAGPGDEGPQVEVVTRGTFPPRAIPEQGAQRDNDDVGAQMIRGLVRAAEMIAARDGGNPWDDEVRKALETARRFGWGLHKVGTVPQDTAPAPNLPLQAPLDPGSALDVLCPRCNRDEGQNCIDDGGALLPSVGVPPHAERIDEWRRIVRVLPRPPEVAATCETWCGRFAGDVKQGTLGGLWKRRGWTELDPVFCSMDCLTAGRPRHPPTASQEAARATGLCEGCKAPAAKRTADDVELCADCFAEVPRGPSDGNWSRCATCGQIHVCTGKIPSDIATSQEAPAMKPGQRCTYAAGHKLRGAKRHAFDPHHERQWETNRFLRDEQRCPYIEPSQEAGK